MEHGHNPEKDCKPQLSTASRDVPRINFQLSQETKRPHTWIKRQDTSAMKKP
jgi:hypothetical protein